MNDKKQALSMLEDEYNRWEELISSQSDEQITSPHLYENYSIKDVIAHLMAWQQVSIARMEAAQRNTEPIFPDWLGGQDPESEEKIEEYNARIYEKYREQNWAFVYTKWREGFQRLLELGAAISKNNLFDSEKYTWLKGYALIAVLEGTYDHHHEDHLEPLSAQINQHKNTK